MVIHTDVRRDHQLRPSRFARSEHGFPKFGDIPKRFEHQQIHTGFEQGIHLLPEQCTSFFWRDPPERLQWRSQRPYTSRYECLLASRFTRDAHPGLIDVPDLVSEPEYLQSLTVSTESIGSNDFRARTKVILMYVAN